MERLEKVYNAIDQVVKGDREVTVYVKGELIDVRYSLRPQPYPNERWYEQQFPHTLASRGRIIGEGFISRADLAERLNKSKEHVDAFYEQLVEKIN